MSYSRKHQKPTGSWGPLSSLKMQRVDKHLKQELRIYLQSDNQNLLEHPETIMLELGMLIWHFKPPFDSKSSTVILPFNPMWLVARVTPPWLRQEWSQVTQEPHYSASFQPTVGCTGQGTKKLSLEKPGFLLLLHRSPERGFWQASRSSVSPGFPPVKWEQHSPSLQKHLEDKYSKFWAGQVIRVFR